MPGKHTELAFENAIEHSLLTAGGWKKGNPKSFDRERALQPEDFLTFMQESQPDQWSALTKQHGKGIEAGLLDTLSKSLESRGTLDVLRHGFKFFGSKVECAFFRPAHGLNPDVLAKYEKNRAVLTRQVHFAADEETSVDLMLSLNGLPVATAELKNPLTNQDVQHAMAQYKGRNSKHTLFKSKRSALVHFAVDPDQAYMTTRLAGDSTGFLPFNRGNGTGAGNPEHPSGHRTAYLWEEVWQRDSFIDIVGRFAHLVKDEKKGDEKVVFPRYHQLDAVRKLEAAARTDGAGTNYLIQHSAGSGKSNSIAWLAHRLASLHSSKDAKVFDSVVVLTDRKVLDKQLQDAIYQFEHKNGVVARIDEDSEQLAKALQSGTPIIITTLQKFPFVTSKVVGMPQRTYAVIVDEAHSSQSGEAAQKMKQVLAAKSLEAAELEEANAPTDEDSVLNAVMHSRGKQKNLSFFAFTATPKAKTLEVFGHRDAEGRPRPFHLYSMRQAIDEGFILDVLKNYTNYKTYFRLEKTAANDPKLPKGEANKQIARFVSFHPHNVAQKTEVMVEHFRAKVRHKIGGRAKAMVVTSSRLHAVRYKKAFEKYIKEKGYADVGVLVAFSGTVNDPEDAQEYTEPGMNKGKDGKHISEAGLRDAFETDSYKVLLVANKYQTGFDQPLLHTMYVDKRLSGLQAVQTLSRLNRTHPGKEDTFILDFVNDPQEIEDSFQPYYEQSIVAESAEPQQLYDLAHELNGAQVFWKEELENFCKVFFAPKLKSSVHDHAQMHHFLNPAVDRFKAKIQEEQDAFRMSLGAYVRLYSFLSQVMPFSDADLEKLYTFCRFLQAKLPQDPKKAPLQLDGEVALTYYRLDKVGEGAITLQAGEAVALYGPTEVGTGKAQTPEVHLSELIQQLNLQFETNFTKADQLLFDQFVETSTLDKDVVQQALANPLENFALAMAPKLDGLMVDRMDQNSEIVSRYLNDPAFKDAAFRLLVKQIYDKARGP